jgi:hypothetical protein
MPRPPRIHVAGTLYHTIARGNGAQRTFLDEKDYQAFVDGLGTIRRPGGPGSGLSLYFTG